MPRFCVRDAKVSADASRPPLVSAAYCIDSPKFARDSISVCVSESKQQPVRGIEHHLHVTFSPTQHEISPANARLSGIVTVMPHNCEIPKRSGLFLGGRLRLENSE